MMCGWSLRWCRLALGVRRRCDLYQLGWITFVAARAKKTQKTTAGDLELALKRSKEIT
jgi:hypothetical protein